MGGLALGARSVRCHSSSLSRCPPAAVASRWRERTSSAASGMGMKGDRFVWWCATVTSTGAR